VRRIRHGFVSAVSRRRFDQLTGVYFPLAGVAMWTSWQESAKASKVMRGVSLAMFVFRILSRRRLTWLLA
jgi:hypothetical protein